MHYVMELGSVYQDIVVSTTFSGDMDNTMIGLDQCMLTYCLLLFTCYTET